MALIEDNTSAVNEVRVQTTLLAVLIAPEDIDFSPHIWFSFVDCYRKVWFKNKRQALSFLSGSFIKELVHFEGKLPEPNSMLGHDMRLKIV